MRVSENTSSGAVGESLRRTRGRMEKLQIQNSTQKKLLTPSDDPAANTKIMDIRTQTTVNSQFESNGTLAKTRLSMADTALSELYDVFVRAKEIAISQSSDASANADSRLGVAQEVSALYKQLVAIANRRVGQQYLFGGFKTLEAPYTPDGEYRGDSGEIPVEVQKDVFVNINVPGQQIFEVKKYKIEDRHKAPDLVDKTRTPAQEIDKAKSTAPTGSQEKGIPIENQTASPSETINIFHELDALRVGLLTNDTVTIRDTMERIDEVIRNVVTTRAKVSSRVAGIDASLSSTQKTDLHNAELATQLEDADYTEIWSNLAKEETVLRSSLHAAQKLIQPTLLEFLR